MAVADQQHGGGEKIASTGMMLIARRCLVQRFGPPTVDHRMPPQARRFPAATLPARLCIVATVASLCFLAACTSRNGPIGHHHGSIDAGPSRYYPPPGTPDDPWGPYIREASGRYGIPERWIREVMHQESDGRDQAVSSAGAMGLMQVMPDTFDDLRQRY
jgi:hypothetical protein